METAVSTEQPTHVGRPKLLLWTVKPMPWELLKKALSSRTLRERLKPIAYWWILRSSGLFDPDYYKRKNPDVRMARLFPLWHYLRKGAYQGRDPNPLFRSSYYLKQYPDVAANGVNPLAHYVRRGASEGRDPSPMFSTSYYMNSNKDAAASGMNPLAHFINSGMLEGHAGCSLQDTLKLTKSYISPRTQSKCMDYISKENNPCGPSSRKLRIGVYTSSEGNYFFNEIRDVVVASIRKCGSQAIVLDETQRPTNDLTHRFVIAPHEFFHLGRGTELRDDRAFRSSVLISTEQLQAKWFILSLSNLMYAPTVLDINFQVASSLRDIGANAHFLPLGFVEGVEWLGDDISLPKLRALESLPGSVRDFRPSLNPKLSDRPIDVLFIGSLSPRREQFFTQTASFLSRYHCFFHLVLPTAPLVEGKTATLTSQAAAGLSQRSKILLNVHRDDLPYFEWHRIVMHGILHKTLVVTEPTFHVPHLKPGRHFVECEREDFPETIEWLLDSSEGKRKSEEIRLRAYQAVRTNYDLANTMKCVLERLLA